MRGERRRKRRKGRERRERSWKSEVRIKGNGRGVDEGSKKRVLVEKLMDL